MVNKVFDQNYIDHLITLALLQRFNQDDEQGLQMEWYHADNWSHIECRHKIGNMLKLAV